MAILTKSAPVPICTCVPPAIQFKSNQTLPVFTSGP
uniref:Uncharacterized protein n=1 Tax=Anguilla anguilla TaxID=7936 RepID=A0A0E9QLF9_ANGAN